MSYCCLCADILIAPAPVSSASLGFPTSPASVDVLSSTLSTGQNNVTAKHAVLISAADKLGSNQEHDAILFHGRKEQNVLVDFGNNSTLKGEPLSSPWAADGHLSDAYLTKGCTYVAHAQKIRGNTVESETVTSIKDTNKPVAYFENLLQTDLELKQLHYSHIPRDTKTLDFDAIAKRLGPNETVLAKIMCKAIVNAPSTGYDVIGDCLLVMTQIALEAPKRRLYFFQVPTCLWCRALYTASVKGR